MIERALYRETFSRLCASQEAKKEVFQMLHQRQQRTRHPRGALRGALLAATVAAALAVTAGAADLATGGILFRSLRQVWTDGYETCYEAVDQQGNDIYLSVTRGASIEKRGDGTLVLRAAGEEVDITETLAERGRYLFERSGEERSVSVEVTGTPETWELTETVTESDGITYTNHLTSDDPEANTGVAVARENGADGNFVTVTQSERRDPLVEDETVESHITGRFSVEPRPAEEVP